MNDILIKITLVVSLVFCFTTLTNASSKHTSTKEVSQSRNKHTSKTTSSIKKKKQSHKDAANVSLNGIPEKGSVDITVDKILNKYQDKVDHKHVREIVSAVYREMPKHDLDKMPMSVIFSLIDSESTWKKASYSTDGSSYGSMQVNYNVWKKTCNLTSARQLYNTNTSVRCGLTVLAHYYDKSNGNIRRTLKYYRGSTISSTNERYANKVIRNSKYF